MKVREIFEYEVLDEETDEDINSLDNVFIIKDYVDCVDDMCCPFWDGMIHSDIFNHTLEIIEN